MRTIDDGEPLFVKRTETSAKAHCTEHGGVLSLNGISEKLRRNDGIFFLLEQAADPE